MKHTRRRILFLLAVLLCATAAAALLLPSPGSQSPTQAKVPAADSSLTDVLSFDLSHECDTTVTNQRGETLVFLEDDLTRSGTIPVKEENYTTMDVQFYIPASNAYSFELEGAKSFFSLVTQFAYLKVEGAGIGAVYLDANGSLVLTPKRFTKMEYSLSVDFLSENEDIQTFSGTSRRTVEFDLK